MMRVDWQHTSIKILSVLLAFILWIHVSNEQNPATEKEINVMLETTGLAQNYLITGGMPESVRVKVRGDKTSLANLVSGDLRAQVNIPDGETGLLTMPVQISVPPGLRVAQVYPDEVSVTIDTLVEKLIPVVVNLRGKPLPGYTVQTPQCQPATVTARGPGEAMSEVSQATAVVNIESAAQNIDLNISVTAGNAKVSLNPAMVRVVVPISGVTFAPKTVPVQPQLTGEPAAGFTVSAIISEPAAVQITGPAETIDAIAEIKTEQVDISGINKNFVQEVDLVPVPGMAGVSPNRVRVRVEVRAEVKTEAETGKNEAQPPAPADGGGGSGSER